MSEVLYRKYRPSKFSEVIGQDHVVRVLEAESKSGEISHAYLFSGTRGTGKTSIARIFAESLGVSKEDIYEIDAASNTSVDDIRTLNESVFTLPFNSKYKVYVLDEVHMLSKSAFNALLKTLEEPPEHVVFILATTETHKIPETVLSRCEVFTFKKPSVEVLKKVIDNVCKKEKVSMDENSKELIAILGDGSFRDTLSNLQKVFSINKDSKISEDAVRVITGAPKIELVHSVVKSISDKNINLGLLAIKEAMENNVDMSIFIRMILHLSRSILLIRFGEEGRIKAELGDSDFAFVKELSTTDKTFSSSVLIELLEALDRTRSSNIPSLPLELALINISK